MSAHLKLAAVVVLLAAVAVTSGSAVTSPAPTAVKKAQRTATTALKQSVAAKKATAALSRRVGKLEAAPVPVGVAPGHLPSVQVVTAASPYPPGTDNSVSVTCPAGTVMTGGGGSVSGVSGNVLTESGPRAIPNVWFVSVAFDGPAPRQVTAYAFCMTP